MLQSFLEIIEALETAQIRYCVIGGIAVLMYGGRASTLDLDLYLVAKSRLRLLNTLRALGASVQPRGEFQYQGKYKGFRFDVLVADRWVGLPALRRAKKIVFGKTSLKIATPEDIIIMKTLADRPIDRRDVQELREILKSIDERYIQKRLEITRRALSR